MKKTGRVLGLIASAIFGLAGVSSVQADAPLTINGAGATFPYPLYSKWFHTYTTVNKTVRFNYQSIGSGGGIQQIIAKTIDFGASDAPMSDDDLAKAGAPLLHIPTVLGAVVLTYNNPKIGTDLVLSGPVVADIFLGKIKKWNDAQIVALNPGKALPDEALLPVYRSDGSGTSYVFTDYLSKVSPEWKAKVGTGKSVKWATGLGAKGNEGVSGMVKQMPSSIGYVELGYALENNLAFASLKNAAGTVVKANELSVSEAANAAIPDDYRVSLTNAETKGAYPISALTYLLVYQTQSNPQKGRAIVDFLKWQLVEGQKLAAALHYAPLPKTLVDRVTKTVDQISVAK